MNYDMLLVEEGLIASHSLSSICKLSAGQVKHSIPFDVIAGGEQRELHMNMQSIRRASFLAELSHFFRSHVHSLAGT
eukprot:scaffold2594_cov135-Chaetoceros_neogracile.AAC.5